MAQGSTARGTELELLQVDRTLEQAKGGSDLNVAPTAWIEGFERLDFEGVEERKLAGIEFGER